MIDDELVYVGGSLEIDMEGLTPNQVYPVHRDLFTPETFIWSVKTFKKILLIDINGNPTGKTAYFRQVGPRDQVLPHSNNTVQTSITSGCLHEWVEYIGFNDYFIYCKKCDEKKK